MIEIEAGDSQDIEEMEAKVWKFIVPTITNDIVAQISSPSFNVDSSEGLPSFFKQASNLI